MWLKSIITDLCRLFLLVYNGYSSKIIMVSEEKRSRFYFFLRKADGEGKWLSVESPLPHKLL